MPQEIYRIFGQNSDLEVKRVFVKISKLLVQRWLGEEPGRQFDNDINDVELDPNPQERLRKALEKQDIYLGNWITPNPDVDRSQGSLTCDESQPGLAFYFNIGLRGWNQNDVTEEVLQQWVNICDQWLEDEEQDPNILFPDVINIHIPLATC
jgi:hypothetical protein